ncbi:uncharacterized protein MONOS_15714 [Monocercomonoides exilis]|uniref:uncharacterized protein n=1 Tax=Monocercomonoides exilis TaxID=2049356 RepID=UPI00355A51B1|nr:hypothetical protein MONOS_15714 [Monocercomonoides exilis]|eukprot:MONOS_15714.1-p1 / transcript=MONOS_15714.1 / gene=MONOS_15714 / organism=Monocercomonoides_exilis_PA203 / gene_product=unspecified product / transcript_product=unspecified product / location=Mono_scaffold01322:8322-8810(+) / protein_length=163 / sequence_SO=supercontig / SO=protein_coding / is_pseudo=false
MCYCVPSSSGELQQLLKQWHFFNVRVLSQHVEANAMRRGIQLFVGLRQQRWCKKSKRMLRSDAGQGRHLLQKSNNRGRKKGMRTNEEKEGEEAVAKKYGEMEEGEDEGEDEEELIDVEDDANEMNRKQKIREEVLSDLIILSSNSSSVAIIHLSLFFPHFQL